MNEKFQDEMELAKTTEKPVSLVGDWDIAKARSYWAWLDPIQIHSSGVSLAVTLIYRKELTADDSFVRICEWTRGDIVDVELAFSIDGEPVVREPINAESSASARNGVFATGSASTLERSTCTFWVPMIPSRSFGISLRWPAIDGQGSLLIDAVGWEQHAQNIQSI